MPSHQGLALHCYFQHTPDIAPPLWLHEAARTFCDRLSDPADLRHMEALINSSLCNNFNTSIALHATPNASEPQVGDLTRST